MKYWAISVKRLRLVIDTSVVVSAILRSTSVPAAALRAAYRAGAILVSDETVEELHAVMGRPSLARYVDADKIADVLRAYCATADWITVISQVRACRDPNDDKFLALALSGNADIIVTGDGDLLDLHPFEEIDIITPREFLDRWAVEEIRE